MTIWIPDLSSYRGPRYKALAAAIADASQSGQLQAGAKLPPQRRLADALGVAVGTVTRAYAEAERLGLVEARVGSGTYIKSSELAVSFRQVTQGNNTQLIDLSLSKMPQINREQFLAQSFAALQNDHAALQRCLSYQLEAGNAYHRDTLAQWLNKNRLPFTAEQLILTASGVHAISMALHTLCQPGDTVFAEGLSYPGFIHATKQQHLKAIGIEFDEQGIVPEALHSALQQHNPRALYLMPSIQNPTAGRMSLQRREAIAQIAQQHQLYIIEDEVAYVPTSERLPTFSSLIPDNTLLLSSFSKGLAGGFRLGCIMAPPHLHAKLEHAVRTSCWNAAPMVAEVICHWITSGQAEAVSTLQHKAVAERQQLVQKYLQAFDISSLDYALHVWLNLPEPWQSHTLIDKLRAQHIITIGAETFAVGRFASPPAIRICIGDVNQHQFTSALATIANTLKQGMDDYSGIM